jgi:hypothetical protein
MLNPSLVGKKLDVRIMGTTRTMFHNGRYENQCGFVILKTAPTNVNNSVTVKIGFEETQRPFLLRYLHPQTTTERPPFVSVEKSSLITSIIGQQVVVIGPDIQQNNDLIGSYGLITNSGWILPPGQALVQCCSPGSFYGKWGYFNEISLCRSHQETGIIPGSSC